MSMKISLPKKSLIGKMRRKGMPYKKKIKYLIGKYEDPVRKDETLVSHAMS